MLLVRGEADDLRLPPRLLTFSADLLIVLLLLIYETRNDRFLSI